METLRTQADLRSRVAQWRRAGESIGLVPTMGALHAGHLALVTRAKKTCDRVVASLFVNPAQFGPGEDFQTYPRDEAADAAMLADLKVDGLYAPEVSEMYPDGEATRIAVTGIGDLLEGEFRPGFFNGVATVVAKLLLQCLPDRAFFGEKDYQQLLVVRRVVADLFIPVVIEGVETVRESDGLALSSRNAYLTESERAAAPTLHRALQDVAALVAAGGDVRAAEGKAVAALTAAGFGPVDYVTVRDADSLAEVSGATPPARALRVLAAARLGRARLIDNIPV